MNYRGKRRDILRVEIYFTFPHLLFSPTFSFSNFLLIKIRYISGRSNHVNITELGTQQAYALGKYLPLISFAFFFVKVY